ncbi:sensor histidine kinase [Romboutsia sp.]|uniref:sensor histidine kinase n=1 Tax=Romboutsia sp. TaxID=1965302 RepID=UPI003F3B5864
MDKYKQLLFESPRPFIIASIIDDELQIKETNIDNSKSSNIKITDIKNNDGIKKIVKYAINGESNNINTNNLYNKYKLESTKIKEDEVIVWFDIEENISDLSKINFLANLTHEFKTPLNLIFSSIQLLNQKIEKNIEISLEDIKKYLNIINQNGYRILKLVNNISDDNKIELGYSSYNPTNSNIIYFIEDICESIESFIKLNNMSLVFDTDVEELIISFDMEKMERIILNLISNAVKFRKKENGKIIIAISHGDEYVNVKVKDDGIGMSKENIEKIFDKYVRLNDERSIVKEGSGIGLALVEALVEQHNGNIYVDSCIGEWTEFNIKIPNKIIEEDNKRKLWNQEVERVEKIKIEFSDIYG